MTLFFANLIGWVQGHWRLVAIAAGIVLLILLAFLTFRSCGKKEVKIDHEAIQKVNSENKAEARKEVEKLVKENADVINAVNERTALSEVNAIESDRKLQEKIAEVNAKIELEKRVTGDVTGPELECILVPENCQ